MMRKIVLTLICIAWLSGCVTSGWYAEHGIDSKNPTSEQAANKYIEILESGVRKDRVRVAESVRGLEFKNDKFADAMLVESESRKVHPKQHIYITEYFMKNEYYERALASVKMGLLSYSNSVKVWHARELIVLARYTDASSLLPILEKMVIHGNEVRGIRQNALEAKHLIEMQQFREDGVKQN